MLIGALILFTAAALAAAAPVSAQRMSTEPIVYTLRFPAPQTHYVEVEAVFPAPEGPSFEVMMAVWTPGSYLVREYARHVEGVRAQKPDGTPLPVVKTRKNRWKVETGGAPRVTVSYRVYAREMSVRTNWVEDRFAMLNGAPTFLTLVEPGARRPHVVSLELPAAWKTSVSALPSDGAPHRYRADSFDTLVDSPIVAGNPTIHRFTVSGREHLLVNTGEAGVWDGARAVADLEKVVKAAEALWGSLPYERYVFFNMITEGSGGLEHLNSTVLMTSRWSTRSRRSYVSWLTTAAHELFHVWNVKRLRPVELGPFDYEKENYTTGLWMAEGLTSYYEHLLLRRAGITSQAELLDALSADIRALQTTPGRLQQPVAAASFDAWIKQYRPDENSPNTAISYYTKGAVIGLLLDAKIRAATRGARSLDDVMRLAYSRYSGERGFTDAEFRAVVHEVVGTSFDPWWTAVLETTNELDYSEMLDWFGLRFRPVDSTRASARAWLGAATRNDGGRLVITQVRRGTPAFDAGLDADDEIIAINDFRVRADQLPQRLEMYRPGETVSMLVARRDELRRFDVTLGREPDETWRLEVRPDVTPEQETRLRAWQGN
ncbi:MAG TPA: PDZ domain-containing protein [Vicinamibacterales bacterium]